MRALRRRLASCALALTALQLALLFSVPVSACCVSTAAAVAHAPSSTDKDCCPAGSHAPGQCPLHKDKGKTSNQLLREFRALNKEFWGRHLWARGYFVATSGNVTDDVIKKYIELQGAEPQDDDKFRISG